MPTPDEASIAQEFIALRKGRGVFAPDLPQRCGPTLQQIFGIGPGDRYSTVHRKAVQALTSLSEDFPPDFRAAFATALAFQANANHRTLRERQEWLADQWQCDVRTVRRRIDESIVLASATAIDRYFAPQARPDTASQDYTEPGWYLERFKVLLRLDRKTPKSFEERRVVATQAGLSQVMTSVAIPKPSPEAPGRQGLIVEVEYGGHLFLAQQTSDSYFHYLVQLPAELSLGEKHEFGITCEIPEGQAMAPRYWFTPYRRCDRFELRVRFDPNALPRAVYRFSALASQMVADLSARDHPISPDPIGEVSAVFEDLKVGLNYGFFWE